MHDGAATLFVVWVITSQWQCEFYCSCVCPHNNEIILAKILGGALAPLPTSLTVGCGWSLGGVARQSRSGAVRRMRSRQEDEEWKWSRQEDEEWKWSRQEDEEWKWSRQEDEEWLMELKWRCENKGLRLMQLKEGELHLVEGNKV